MSYNAYQEISRRDIEESLTSKNPPLKGIDRERLLAMKQKVESDLRDWEEKKLFPYEAQEASLQDEKYYMLLQRWIQEYKKVDGRQAGDFRKAHETSRVARERLSSGTLASIGISQAEAEKYAKKRGYTDIRTFQKEHGLEVDGKIGRETYMEMFTEQTIIKLDGGIKTGNLDKKTQRDIEFALKNPYGGLEIDKKLIAKLNIFENKYRNEKKYKSFFARADVAIAIGGRVILNRPESKEAYEANSQNAQSNGLTPLENLLEGNFAEAIKDPRSLLVLGVLFLFGAFPDTKMTDSVWKRIGVLVAIPVLGGGEAFGKILDKDWGGMVENVVDKVSVGAKKGYQNGRDGAEGFYEGLYGSSFASISGAFGKQFDNITGSISSYNENLKKENGGADYIESEKLEFFQDVLLGDEKFLNTSKTALETIGTKENLHNYITADTKVKLSKAGIDDKSINSFIHKHLLKNSFDSDDEFVSDIFLTSEMKKKFYEAKLNLGGDIIEGNTKLDDEIKKGLSNLINSIDKAEQHIGKKLAIALYDGKLDTFTLDNFPAIKGEQKHKIHELINKFKFILKGEHHVKQQIVIINGIKITRVGEYPETQNTLETKLTQLEELELNEKILEDYDFSTQKFEDKKKEKEEDIIRAANDLGITSLIVGTKNIDVVNKVKVMDLVIKNKREEKKAEREETEKENKLIQAQNILKKLGKTIGEVPDETKTPLEFKTYWETNILHFKEVQKTLDESKEKSIQDLAKDILKRKETFKTTYQKLKEKYIAKITIIDANINSINVSDTADMEISRKELNQEKDKYEQILRDVMMGTDYLEELKNIWNQIGTGLIVFGSKQSAFNILDKKLELPPNISIKTNELLYTKNYNLEQNYNVDIDVSKFNIDNIATINTIIVNISDKYSIISTFEHTGLKKEKILALKREVTQLVNIFIKKIEGEKDLEKLMNIYSIYTDLVYEKIGPTFGVGGLIMNTDQVEKIYIKHQQELKKDHILDAPNIDFEGDLKNIGVYQFFVNNSDSFGIKPYINEFNKAPDSITVKQLLEMFKDISKWNKQKNADGKLEEIESSYKKDQPDEYRAREEAINILDSLNELIESKIK